MNDYYAVLGLRRGASKEEIKKRYRELAKKYHPDQYTDTPIYSEFEEKMKKINDAYDALMRSEEVLNPNSSNNSYRPNSSYDTEVKRSNFNNSYSSNTQYKENTRNGSYSQYSSYSSGNYSNDTSNAAKENKPIYDSVRFKIDNGQFDEAEALLSSVSQKTADWFYLMGVIHYNKNWYQSAVNYIETATKIDPYNKEYLETFNLYKSKVRNFNSSYNNKKSRDKETDFCALCTTIWCANWLCC